MNKSNVPVTFTTLLLATALTRLASSESVGHPNCPAEFTCTISENLDSLQITCTFTSALVLSPSLSDEINILLSKMNETLRHLSIADCNTDFPSEVCNLELLESLELNRMGFEHLPENCVTHLRHLQSFVANGNNITMLQDGLFNGLTKLRKVSLQRNRIASIGPKLFSSSSNLRNLKMVDLTHNNLSELDTWPFSLAHELPNLSIYLLENPIKSFTNQLKQTYHCGMNINSFKLYVDDAPCAISGLVKELNITNFTDAYCLLNKTLIEVDGDSRCDCMYYKLQVFCSDRTRIATLPCGRLVLLGSNSFENNGSPFRPLDELVCQVANMCPSECRCVNQPSTSTFHVICHNSGLRDIPTNVPSLDTPSSFFIQKDLFKYKLDFSGNNISTFRPREYIHNAKIVDLSSSGLVNITDEAMRALEKVNKIYLHNNLLRTLPKVVTTLNFSFTIFSFYKNPLSCDCDQLWLKHWLIEVYDHLDNPNAIECSTPQEMRAQTIFQLSDSCSNEVSKNQKPIYSNIYVTSILALPFLTLIACFILIHRFRFKVYTRFGVHPFDRDECEGEEMIYDVFISFAHEDSEQAREVYEFLKGHLLKVCFHELHFMPGEGILGNMQMAIKGSKRVLCLVSDNFISSAYCLEEFERALHHHISLKRRRLVVMISDQCELLSCFTRSSAQRENKINDHIVPAEDEQLLFTTTNSSEEVSERTVILADFVGRHTHIKFRFDSSSWQQQLLYAMPVKRLGRSPSE